MMIPSPEQGLPLEEGDLQEEGQRIAWLLEELRGAVGPQTFRSVEELVQRIVHLYGAALGRILHHIRTVGSRELESSVQEDALISSLLLLHGHHSLSTEERIRRVLEEVRPQLIASAEKLNLLGIGKSGIVEVSLSYLPQAASKTRAALEEMIRRAVEEAAPEVSGVRILDQAAAAAAQGFVRLKLPGER